jgi:phosphotransferase system enzyme I (PtsI)
MRERAADVRDVGRQLLSHLTGRATVSLSEIDRPVIVVANDLTPSDTAQLPKGYVRGFTTEIGGRTSHSAIMARAMSLPAVLGVGSELLSRVKAGDVLILDGNNGKLIVNPTEDQMSSYRELVVEEKAKMEQLTRLKDLPAETTDGHRVELGVNIGRPEDLPPGLEKGVEGVGLFRSEFLYMDRSDFPSEDEQFSAYRQAAELADGLPVIVRTLDIGGDKHLPYFDLPKELNPFLGWRALRISLDRVDLFKTQLRAILRASAFGKLRIMFPMVSNIEQVRKAKDIIKEVKTELDRENTSYDRQLEVGVMIEIPAAALIAAQLAHEVDFFSIGTNDLVQYTLAVDRMNERVANLYDHFHPAVVRLIAQVIQASHQKGIWTGMCGEMAGDPLAAPLLIGLGLDEFSMGASSIPLVKERIRGIRYEEAKGLAQRIIDLATPEEVLHELKQFAKIAHPGG